MKTHKRISIFILTLIMLISSVFPAYATPISQNKCAPEILASKAISSNDDKISLICTDDYVLVSVDKEISSSTDFLFDKSFNSEDREVVSTAYITETPVESIALFEKLEKIAESTPNALQSGSSSLEGKDKNYCATFFMTVNYTKYSSGGDIYYDLTTITGGFRDPNTTGTYVGENVYVTSLTLDVAQSGTFPNGNYSQAQTRYGINLPEQRSWSYSTPSNWIAVCGLGPGISVGATYYFTLTRGSSSWTSSLQIDIASGLSTF